MAFMKPEAEHMTAYMVEVGGETCCVPTDVCDVPDELAAKAIGEDGYVTDEHLDEFADGVKLYLHQIGDVTEIKRVEGWFARLSAPGYLDATEWCGPFYSEDEALGAVMEMFDCDEDGNDIDG